MAKLKNNEHTALTGLSNMLREWAASEATTAAADADSRQSSLMVLLGIGFPMCVFLSLWVARSVTVRNGSRMSTYRWGLGRVCKCVSEGVCVRVWVPVQV